MFLEYPKRKTYSLTVETKYGFLVLEYLQATAQETMDYMQIYQKKSDDYTKAKQITEYRKNRILSCKKTYKKKRYRTKKQVLQEAIGKLEVFIEQIIHSYHKSRESVYSGVSIPREKNSKQGFFDSSLFALSKISGIPTDQVYDRLTREQVLWLYDKMTHDHCMSFKDGEVVNIQVLQRLKANNPEEKQKTKEITEYINSKMPKDLYKNADPNRKENLKKAGRKR